MMQNLHFATRYKFIRIYIFFTQKTHIELKSYIYLQKNYTIPHTNKNNKHFAYKQNDLNTIYKNNNRLTL